MMYHESYTVSSARKMIKPQTQKHKIILQNGMAERAPSAGGGEGGGAQIQLLSNRL